LIADALGVKKDQFTVTFQSRFGRAEWLQPYTDKTLEALGKQGIKRVDVICPGFAADCLETLEEIADEAKVTFLNAGGSEFHYIPVANDTPAFVGALTEIAREHLVGWVSEDWDRDVLKRVLDDSSQRARAMGATK
jgi:ferrochelatase